MDVARLAILMGLLTVGDAVAQTRAAPVTRPPPPPAVRPRPPAMPERLMPSRSPTLPDLIVLDISPGSGLVVATIRNVGSGSAPAGQVALFVSGSGRTDRPTPALAPGASAVIRFRAPASGARFQIMVDPDDLIREANESNNRPLVQTMPGASGRVAAPSAPPVGASTGVFVTTPPIQFTGDPNYVVKPVAAEMQVTTPAIQFTGDPTYVVDTLPPSIAVTTPTIRFTGNP